MTNPKNTEHQNEELSLDELKEAAGGAKTLISAKSNMTEIQPNQQYTHDVLYTTLDEKNNP